MRPNCVKVSSFDKNGTTRCPLEVTKWNRACDKRLARLIGNIDHTASYKLYCHVGNNAIDFILVLFQDADFCRTDSKSTSGGVLWKLESDKFVPISSACEKQTPVSHSSTEAEIVSLDAGLRMVESRALNQ